MPVTRLQQEVVAGDTEPSAQSLEWPPDVEDVRKPVDLLRIVRDAFDLTKTWRNASLSITLDFRVGGVKLVGPVGLIRWVRATSTEIGAEFPAIESVPKL